MSGPAASAASASPAAPLRLRRDLEIAPVQAEGRDWIVVRNPDTQRYFRLSASAFGVLRDLDGAATAEDIARCRAVGADAVAGIAEQARRAGILIAEQQPAPAGTHAVAPGAANSALSFEVCACDPAAAALRIGRWLGVLFDWTGQA